MLIPTFHTAFTSKTPYRHSLVAVGDSLAQGFQNGGIARTDLSFPSMIARAMGPGVRFETPSFVAQGGIPLNLEALLRGLQDEFGREIGWNESLSSVAYIIRTLKRVKDHWEGRRRPLSHPRDTPWHLQAVWGFAMNDAWLITERLAHSFIEQNEETFSVFSFLPEHAMYTTARLVTNPSLGDTHRDTTLLDNVAWFAADGGIENLICCLGHNNYVRAASELRLTLSESTDLGRFHGERSCTVFRPEHFELDLRILFEKLAMMRIRRVFVPTFPHISCAPVIRGVNLDGRIPTDGYYDYYTRFWLRDGEFSPERHAHLTRADVLQLDAIVDGYNQILIGMAESYGFHVVPVNRFVSRLAGRPSGHSLWDRASVHPKAMRAIFAAHPSFQHLPAERPLTTEFIRINSETGLVNRGGVFSLDGIHPTTIGYGMIADLYIRTMKKAGVRFERALDWERIIREDELLSHPPYLIRNLDSILSYMALDRREIVSKLGETLLDRLKVLLDWEE